jgi:hypothetical protein
MAQLAQRYVRAVGSGNLRSDELHFDTDVLAAMALSSTYGGLLFRAKYFNDPASYRRLLNQWTWIVSTKAERRGWPVHIPVDKVARISLRIWANDVCPACTGRKMVTIFNTPSLSDKVCPLCNGTGKTELRCDQSLRDYVLDMIEELTADERKAGARGARKLGKQNSDISDFMPAQKSA